MGEIVHLEQVRRDRELAKLMEPPPTQTRSRPPGIDLKFADEEAVTYIVRVLDYEGRRPDAMMVHFIVNKKSRGSLELAIVQWRELLESLETALPKR